MHINALSLTLTLSLALPFSQLVSAGPHTIRRVHRRHHAKVARGGEFDLIRRDQGDGDCGGDDTTGTAGECTSGAWQCVGAELQRCNQQAWVSIANCTGTDVVCSADDSVAVGCVWSWTVNSNSTSTSAPASSAIVSSAGLATSSTSSAGSAPTDTTSTDPASGGDGSSDDDGDDGGDDGCDDGSLTDAEASSILASASITSSASVASASITNAPISSTSAIGENLLAGGGSSSSSRRKGHHSSSSTDSGAVSSTTDDWSASSTQDWYGASVSASTTDFSASIGQATSISSTHHGKGHSISVSASSTASAAAASSSGKHKSNSTSTSHPGSYSAPHYVIYADEWLYNMPAADSLSGYNRFILAFWMTNEGAVDDAQFWEQLDSDTRASVISDYHDAGIALMVSAFGSTDSPTSNGADPTQTAQQLAAWVKQYGLDGVDIDYEDMPAMNSNQAESWIITFQKELRKQLPSPYLISHAPVAPWFTSAPDYAAGAYVYINQEVGDGIDFYNVQFYNQGDGVYGDCNSLVVDSGSSWPDTSVMQINSYAGVPLDKIVIGKPLDEGAADNGFVDASVLAGCVTQAQALGWNAGVMFWEWTTSAQSLMATVQGLA